jgi:hypothetical protein
MLPLDNAPKETISPTAVTPEVKVKPKNHYFDNDLVQEILKRYVARGCVDIELRDEIMHHSEELIRQVIRAHNFEHIFPNRDASSATELFQVAYCQIEKVLYKYDPQPGSPKLFNLWSQVAKTRILAYLKKEKRDKKNVVSYKDFLSRKHKTKLKGSTDIDLWLKEAREMMDYNEDFLEILKSLEEIWYNDEKPYDGLISKLEKASSKNRNIISHFFKTLRIRRDEFTVNLMETKDHKEVDLGDSEDFFYVDQDQ